MEIEFLEQIFYHNADNSTFLEASSLSDKGLKLDHFSKLPSSDEAKIEFSFPNSEYIVKATVEVKTQKGSAFLKFTEISEDSKKQIKSFIRNSKSTHSELTL